jgi:hypothetical protein
MKYIKLFLISVIVFGVMLFCISLLFPTTTIVSRAVNVLGSKTALQQKLPEIYEVAFQDTVGLKKLQNGMDSSIRSQEGEFNSSAYKIDYRDTLLFTTPFANHIQQGVALYELQNDSTAVQVFYQIHVPHYKFWKKFGLMLNEAKYGPFLDSATKRIATIF